MALIECKDYGHKVSDKAECCPNCGCPIEEIMSADASNNTNVSQVYDDAVQFDDIPPKKSKGWLWTIVVILVLAAIGVGVWLFTNGKLGEDDPTTAKVEITPEFIAAVHQYDELYPFSEGLAAVKKDGQFGYINTKGELVIPCQYQYASSFKEGLACVVKDEEDNNISFIDAKGEILHTKYPFNPWYYMGGSGQTYIGPAISFTNGVCEIKYTLGDNIGEEPQTVYIDRQMKEVAQPAEESTQSEENLGYEIFRVSDKDIYGDETSLVGVKDKDGEIVIPAKYYDLEICDNGVVLARMFIESAESRFYQAKIGYGLTVYGYIDFTGKSTFTDADMGKLEGYKEAQIPAMTQLKLEAEQEEREEQARLEEERRQEESQKGPEWINGVWECHEMVDLGYFGRQRANARLCIDRENQMVSSNNDGEKYNGRYTISGNEIHFGSWYADLDNSRERIEFGKGVYYRKVSSSYTYGSSSNSSSGSSGSRSSYSGSSRTSFSSPSDVLSYTSSNSFYNGGDRLRIGFDAVYLNGTALTGAPRVTNISGSSATIIASNPYGGRALHFYVNASSGTITQNGDVYRAR